MLGCHAPADIDMVMEWQQNAKSGKQAVLVILDAQRCKVMPDVPTFMEQGFPDDVGQVWLAMYAPAKTPFAAIDEIIRH